MRHSTDHHRADPLVLGVSRDPGGPDAKRFFDRVPDARPLIETDRLRVCAVGPVERSSTSMFLWGGAVPVSSDPRTWREASESGVAAGVSREDDSWIVFTDSLGVHAIHHRVIGQSTFFSTRLWPLIDPSDRLHPDWDAWASVLTLGAPIGTATPFAEILRLDAASGLKVAPDGEANVVQYLPRWMETARSPSTARDVVEAIRTALPPRFPLKQPPSIPLSGGWDSRLLAALASDRYTRKPRTWTTSTDDGMERDLEYAESVARTLNLPHHVVTPPFVGWPERTSEARHRVEFQTWLHPWFIPLCRRLHEAAPDVLDGLGGDVLIKGLFVDRELLGEHSSKARRERLFARLGGRPDLLIGFRDEVAQAIVSTSSEAFDSVADRFDGHQNEAALTVLHTRTARAIALAPLLLIGPETKTWLPFLSESVLRHTLSIDPESKTEAQLYRPVLREGAPTVADLPSTNDARSPDEAPERSLRAQESREAVAWMSNAIMESDLVRGLLRPEYATQLHKGTYPPRGGWRTSRFLQIASLLAHWETEHAANLADTPPPW